MSDASTTRMLAAYIQRRVSPPLFLSSFFTTTPRSFHNSEHIELDIGPGEPYLALPVQSVTIAARKHESGECTINRFMPLVDGLEGAVAAWTAPQRRPGVDPFQVP